MNQHVALQVPDVHGYDSDLCEWSMRQAEILRTGRFDLLDVENVAEEIESLARSDRRTIEKQMVRLAEHLLKLTFAQDRSPRHGWQSSVIDSRDEIALVVRDSPSLRRELPGMFEKAWPRAVRKAVNGLSEFGDTDAARLAASVAPTTVDQALDPDFFPGD